MPGNYETKLFPDIFQERYDFALHRTAPWYPVEKDKTNLNWKQSNEQ